MRRPSARRQRRQKVGDFLRMGIGERLVDEVPCRGVLRALDPPYFFQFVDVCPAPSRPTASLLPHLHTTRIDMPCFLPGQHGLACPSTAPGIRLPPTEPEAATPC